MTIDRWDTEEQFEYWRGRFAEEFFEAWGSFEARAAEASLALELESNDPIASMPGLTAQMLENARQDPDECVRLLDCTTRAVNETIVLMLEAFDEASLPSKEAPS